VAFLQWALPRLHMRWPGFRKVRKQVCKRIGRRLKALALPDVAAYRAYLETHPTEWSSLDAMCRVSISRFYRDRGVFDQLRQTVLPALAEGALSHGENELLGWSIGCASGEETYTVSLIWQLDFQDRFPDLRLHFLATDSDPALLQRAQAGCYPASSLKELPPQWRGETAFAHSNGNYCLREQYRAGCEFRQQDIRQDWPDQSFHLILCRNLVFTYFAEVLQQQLLAKISRRLLPGGVFIIGKSERLPDSVTGLTPWLPKIEIYRRAF
jgi:chemotaxis protein methyltransferase CheR